MSLQQQSLPSCQASGFTLVELMVVMAIISVLMAILLPTLEKTVSLGRQTSCLSNMRQVNVCVGLYANDNNDFHTGYYLLGETYAYAGLTPTVSTSNRSGMLYLPDMYSSWSSVKGNSIYVCQEQAINPTKYAGFAYEDPAYMPYDPPFFYPTYVPTTIGNYCPSCDSSYTLSNRPGGISVCYIKATHNCAAAVHRQLSTLLPTSVSYVDSTIKFASRWTLRALGPYPRWVYCWTALSLPNPWGSGFYSHIGANNMMKVDGSAKSHLIEYKMFEDLTYRYIPLTK